MSLGKPSTDARVLCLSRKMATSLQKTVHQNLECPVCMSFFKNPKILTCSHTFCEGCLKALLGSHPEKGIVSCPTCRKETPVPDGDVDRLQTNIAVRSLVEDLETQSHVCSNCKSEDKNMAVAFCSECGDFLCDFCRIVHLKWTRYSGHSIVGVSDASSGKILQRRWSKCPKHPTDNEECFCLDCSRYVCFKCGLLEHANEVHKVLEASLYETEQKKNVDELVSKACAKIGVIAKYILLVAEKHIMMKTVEKQLNSKIDEALEEAVRKLKERNEILKNEVHHQMKEIENALRDIQNTSHEQFVQVSKLFGLVKDGLQFPLEKEALTSHKAMCQQLESLLSQIKPNDELLSKTAEKGERLDFRSQELDELKLGQLRQKESKWILQAEEQLPIADGMDGMAVSPMNMMAVGCYKKGIFRYSTGGERKETVLKTVKVRALQFMPNGRYVIRDTDNRLFMYTELCEKLDVAFESVDDAEGGHGGLTVDKDGLIFTSYNKCETIHVLKQEGGKAIREIPCNEFTPMQIFAMRSRQAIVVSNCSNSIRVIDRMSGATIHSITKVGVFPSPAVCKDDSVIIAWVKHDQGLMSIDRYTKELKHVKSILTNFKITKPSRRWYYLQQFKTGELAFCTPDKLYIFRETWE